MAAADGNAMGSLIRLAAIVASAIVSLGFVAFAVDELEQGSQHTQAQLAQELGTQEAPTATVAPTAAEEQARERRHGAAREALDDANDVLLAPFADMVESDNAWVQRGVPTLLALALYGVGLGMLANFLPRQRRDRPGDWRTA
jgi:hypothetical protein